MLKMRYFIFTFLSLNVMVANGSILDDLMRITGISNMKSNPDENLSTLQMIRRSGYPAEAHVIVTEDGYLLTVHRIPGRSGSPAIFLQHGLLGSSADWVILGKEKSLAYLLADKGYDVWIGNFRGNTYSRAHISLSTSSSKFWNFSWTELGIYDLPAVVSYIVKYKNDNLHAYIGHSMGTTTFYVMAIERPEIAKYIQLMISLAPVTFLDHVKSPIRFIAPFANDYQAIAHFLGRDEFLPQNIFLKFLAKFGCEINFMEKEICTNSLFVIVGFDKAQFNYTLLPTILNHTPAGTSTKTVVHYAQEIESGHFRPFDYGSKKNKKIYNSSEPPDYDLSLISVPIALLYSDNDWLATPIDVIKISKLIPNLVNLYRVPFTTFNHVDFLWGIDAPKLVYKEVFNLLKAHRTHLTKIKYSQLKKYYNRIRARHG